MGEPFFHFKAEMGNKLRYALWASNSFSYITGPVCNKKWLKIQLLIWDHNDSLTHCSCKTSDINVFWCWNMTCHWTSDKVKHFRLNKRESVCKIQNADLSIQGIMMWIITPADGHWYHYNALGWKLRKLRLRWSDDSSLWYLGSMDQRLLILYSAVSSWFARMLLEPHKDMQPTMHVLKGK